MGTKSRGQYVKEENNEKTKNNDVGAGEQMRIRRSRKTITRTMIMMSVQVNR